MQCRSGFSVAIDVSVFIVDTVSVIVVVALIVVITTADVVVVVVTVEGGEVADALLSRTKYLRHLFRVLRSGFIFRRDQLHFSSLRCR